MKLALYSDLHIEFKPIMLSPGDAEVVAVVGDVLPIRAGNAVHWLAEQIPDRPVLFVPGNHDYYGGNVVDAHAAWRKAAKGTQVSVLINDAITLGGVRFLGTPLYSDLSLPSRWPRGLLEQMVERNISDFMTMRRSPALAAQGRWRVQDMVEACTQARAFLDAELPPVDAPGPAPVVLTHWAPSVRSCAPQFLGDDLNPYFLVPCEDLVARAQAWLHGHVHNPCHYRVGARADRGDTWCNPRGYVYRDGRQERPGVYAPLMLELTSLA